MSIFLAFLSVFLLALGLSADAFAVAVSRGLGLKRPTVKQALLVGAYFGVFQAVMPLIGYYLAKWFSSGALSAYIEAADHWVAFVLLAFLGGKMIIGGLKKEGCRDRVCPEECKCGDRECPGGKPPEQKKTSLAFKAMLPLALATSIDALAAGIALAMSGAEIFSAIATIGAVTFILSAVGVMVARVLGAKVKGKAELLGGIILIAIGAKIVIEHLFF